MDPYKREIARQCLDAAETDKMTFPEIVGLLIQAGFESYVVDFRRGDVTYYLPDGACTVLPLAHSVTPITAGFNAELVQQAIREAQNQAPGYSYRGFCDKVGKAGCAGYIVSFTGRRVVYYGRTAEMHVEHFPQ